MFISIFISASKGPATLFTFNALAFYRSKLAMHGINTLAVSFPQAIQQLAKLKKGFEDKILIPPASINEVDLQDEKAVIAAYEKVKAGSRAKQVLINRNA